MTNPNRAAQSANDNPLSDEYVNAVIQQHGYDSPESVIAQLHQWIGLHGGEDTVTLLMYEAHKALSKLRAPVSDIREGFELIYSADADDPACASDLGHFTNGWRACIMSQVGKPVVMKLKVDTTAAVDLIKDEVARLRAPVADMYVEARECGACGHVGINDSSDTLAACKNCDWSGESPKEDHCPGCAQNGTMTAACPKCGSQYSLLADRVLEVASAPVADTAAIIRDVCELDPAEEGPETVRVTVADLTRIIERHSAPVAGEAQRPELAVWYGPMPESNGKSNWTAILYCKDDGLGGGVSITIDRSEYPDRVRYEADRARFLIGEIDEEPWILDYDADKCDAAPQASAEPARILFPAHLRKMWSGGEVQTWLDQHQGVTNPPANGKGSLARYRQWKAEQGKDAAPCTCPSGDGSLRHPCPAHPQGKPPAPSQPTDKEQA